MTPIFNYTTVRVDGGIVFVNQSDTQFEKNIIEMVTNNKTTVEKDHLDAMLIAHRLWCPRYNLSGVVHFFDPNTVTFVCDKSKFVFHQDENCNSCIEPVCECGIKISLATKVKRALENVQISGIS